MCKPEGGGIPGPRAATAMTKKMTERARELGVEFLLETPVHKIIMEDGRAVGVLAKDKDGEKLRQGPSPSFLQPAVLGTTRL
ncbi:MAG: FAD-binding protein [Enterocloster bolteae]